MGNLECDALDVLLSRCVVASADEVCGTVAQGSLLVSVTLASVWRHAGGRRTDMLRELERGTEWNRTLSVGGLTITLVYHGSVMSLYKGAPFRQ